MSCIPAVSAAEPDCPSAECSDVPAQEHWVHSGIAPPINDTETYDNGTGIIPSYLCPSTVCDIANYKELLIVSGYYTEDQLEGRWDW